MIYCILYMPQLYLRCVDICADIYTRTRARAHTHTHIHTLECMHVQRIVCIYVSVYTLYTRAGEIHAYIRYIYVIYTCRRNPCMYTLYIRYMYVQEKFGCPNCNGIFEAKTGKRIGDLVEDPATGQKVRCMHRYIDDVDCIYRFIYTRFIYAFIYGWYI